MKILTQLLIGMIALIHFGILALEMFFWTAPFVQDRFSNFTPEELSTILAANQGLYNGFLAAGLLWGLLEKQKSSSIWIFFLSCIAIAGIYGSFSLGRPTALLLQTVPAGIALLLLIGNRNAAKPFNS